MQRWQDGGRNGHLAADERHGNARMTMSTRELKIVRRK
jgi:hypothetical protein